MPKVTQLTVPCENRPGALARITTVLGDAEVNIVGFLLSSVKTKSYVKLIVDDVEKAKEALYDAELPYFETVVLHGRIPNRPGALGRLAGRLAAKNINIISAYQTIEKDSKKASVVLEVSNLEQALRASRTPSDRL
jgi:hypothetical protein